MDENVEYCSYKGLTHNDILQQFILDQLELNIVLIKD